VAAGTSCSDGNVCNGAETCNSGGTCGPGTPLTIDDGNPCTTDACDPTNGVTHAPMVAGTSCSDGNACNGTEACDSTGHCQPGTPVVCPGADQCHAAGVCDTQTGSCSSAVLTGSTCSDGNECTGPDTCQSSGACVGSAVADATPCNGTSGNTCIGGVCTPAN
jgi:hypothetical protein